MAILDFTDEDYAFIEDRLIEYGNDESILSAPELHGFLTSVVSSPQLIPPSQWYPLLWGSQSQAPKWQDEAEMKQFHHLVFGMMNQVARILIDDPDSFEPLLLVNEVDGKEIWIAEDWCFGYMAGVALWADQVLPKHVQTYLDVIALHGQEDNFDLLEQLSLDTHQKSIDDIAPATVGLQQYFLAFRSENIKKLTMPTQTLFKSGPKVGRNEPCPCGSGKKLKYCCLQ